MINMAGPACKTPPLAPAKLAEMGYKIAIYPTLPMDAAVNGLRWAYARLRDEGVAWDEENIVGPQKFFEIMGLNDWLASEKKYQPS